MEEGLIDHVDVEFYGEECDENPYYTVNVVANKKLKLSGRIIDASEITKRLLVKDLHEVDSIVANVATGYHPIEFLLWRQDLNGSGPGAGSRRAIDVDPANCTGGNCRRHAAYLKAVTDLLVDDLTRMTACEHEARLWYPKI